MTKLCHHVKEDGISCYSPALRGGYCHFHLRYKGHRSRTWRSRRTGSWRLELPVLDNLDAVLASIEQVKRAMFGNLVDGETAGLMLYGLRQAAANLRGTDGTISDRSLGELQSKCSDRNKSSMKEQPSPFLLSTLE